MMTNSPLNASKYSMGFSAGDLFLKAAPAVAQVYRELADWGAVRREVQEKNLLQTRTLSTSKRLVGEVVGRLAELTDSELELLVEGTVAEQRQVLWVSACRKYGFLGDFAEGVVRERFLLFANSVTVEDLESFIAEKSLWHPELEQLKASTLGKLKSTVFLLLRQAEILNSEGMIIPAIFSERVRFELARSKPSDFRFFPTRETE